ncbi:MAG: DUF2800 domain-containing protein [Bacteroidota bacterium]|nr:DUF2800 domain-containing protein [Bacteroidota bacterium]
MMPGSHAFLSASSSHRWLHCSPSARLEQAFEDRSSEAAAEGTAAHELCEYKLRRALRLQAEMPVSPYWCEEMDGHTDGYVEFVLETLAEARTHCTDPVVRIEQRLDFSDYVIEGFGTGDCVIIADDTLYVIDFKYGQGVLVESENNPQMMLYALGAIKLFGPLYDFRQVSLSIYQPRRQNLSTWNIPVNDLLTWAEDVLKPAAKLAYEGKGEYCPGEWCRFCRASVLCRARAEEKLRLARYEFRKPPLLTDPEIGEILGKLDDLTHWANEIKGYALQQAISGKEWHGWKLVEGRSNRRYTDEAAVEKTVTDAGYDPYERKLLGITAMQKLLGKARFEELLAAYIEKPQGKPTLVPESDKRPAMNTAEHDFMEENDNE